MSRQKYREYIALKYKGIIIVIIIIIIIPT
jgi:hypothetical protein